MNAQIVCTLLELLLYFIELIRIFARLTTAFDRGFERRSSNLYYRYLQKH